MTQKAMKIEDLHPDFQEVYARLPILPLDKFYVRMLLQFLMGIRNPQVRDPDVLRRTEKLSHKGVRIYEPVENHSGAGILWIHGGGMVLGKASMNDKECSRFVKKLGVSVVSTDYRLAPRHKYPAAIDDCYEAWMWLVEHSEQLGVDANRLAVAGQSAGGGLAAALCQRIQDQGGIQPKAQILFYPMIDDRTTQRSDLTEIKHLGWSNTKNLFGWSSYIGKNAGITSRLPPGLFRRVAKT